MANKDFQELDYLRDILDESLISFGIEGFVSDGFRTDTTDTFQITTVSGTRFKKIKDLEQDLAVDLGKNSIRVFKNSNGIFIEVPRKNNQISKLDELIFKLKNVPKMTAILGISTEGKPLGIRITSSECPHILIAGTTGSGKTALLRSFLVSLAYFNGPNQLSIILIDPKGRGLKPLEKLPQVQNKVLNDVSEIVKKLNWAVQEMEARDKNEISEPRIVIAIDELVDLITVAEDEIKQPLSRLLQRGRQAGIHVIAGTQKPSAGLLGTNLIPNFPVRLVGAVANKTEARTATGIAGSGAELLNGKGDFLIVISGITTRFQAAYLDSEGFVKLGNRKGK